MVYRPSIMLVLLTGYKNPRRNCGRFRLKTYTPLSSLLHPLLIFFFPPSIPSNRKAQIHLDPKHLLQLPHRIFRTLHAMPDRPLIRVNFIIVAALVRHIAEEVDRRVLDTADVFFLGEVLQAVGLVPAGGKDVKGDFAADGVAEGRVGGE